MKQRLLILVKSLKHNSRLFAAAFGVFYAFYKSALLMRGLFSWFFLAPVQALLPAGASSKRLLIIYDLSAQPFSIGDIITFQEASLVLLEELGCAAVDFALVYNPANPALPDPALATITEENCLFHLASILPVAQVNQKLGSLLLFNSHDHLERYVADNTDRYRVWPTAGRYLTREYMFYRIFNELFLEFYKKNGRLPHLRSRAGMLDWCADFFRQQVFPSIPVALNLRRNIKNPERNSDYDAWLAFFNRCNGRYPAKFIVIGSESEIDDRFRGCPNVLIAKDFRTHLEQDLALLDGAAIHMGAPSGPATMALYSDKPYLWFNVPMKTLLEIGFVLDGDFAQIFFATPFQRITTAAETLEVMETEFAKMWSSLDLGHWEEIINRQPSAGSDHYSWLR